nr:MAG: hypothetical protein [Cressdnaviricota sp.]
MSKQSSVYTFNQTIPSLKIDIPRPQSASASSSSSSSSSSIPSDRTPKVNSWCLCHKFQAHHTESCLFTLAQISEDLSESQRKSPTILTSIDIEIAQSYEAKLQNLQVIEESQFENQEDF